MDQKIPKRLVSNHTHESNDNKSGLGGLKNNETNESNGNAKETKPSRKRSYFHSLKIDDKNTDGSVGNITNDRFKKIETNESNGNAKEIKIAIISKVNGDAIYPMKVIRETRMQRKSKREGEITKPMKVIRVTRPL